MNDDDIRRIVLAYIQREARRDPDGREYRLGTLFEGCWFNGPVADYGCILHTTPEQVERVCDVAAEKPDAHYDVCVDCIASDHLTIRLYGASIYGILRDMAACEECDRPEYAHSDGSAEIGRDERKGTMMDKPEGENVGERLETGLAAIARDTANELGDQLLEAMVYAMTETGQAIGRAAYDTWLGIREQVNQVSGKVKNHDWDDEGNDDPYRHIRLFQAWLLAEMAACERRKEIERAECYYRLLIQIRYLLDDATRKRTALFNRLAPTDWPWGENPKNAAS